uniref:Post-SET domain-containing protein n=1 Tax=Trichogramma kaykai TaxID=54128 RepID=A0ABD2WTU6_9HYME
MLIYVRGITQNCKRSFRASIYTYARARIYINAYEYRDRRRRRRRRRRRGETGKEARGIAGGRNRQARSILVAPMAKKAKLDQELALGFVNDHDDDDDDILCNARGWLEPRDSVKPCSHLNYLVGGEKSREVGGSLCRHTGVDAELVLLVVVKTKYNRLPAILNLQENKLISLRDSSCCCCTNASCRGSLPRTKNIAMAIGALCSSATDFFSVNMHFL